MTKYREILRLLSLGISQRNIFRSLGVSRNTVAKIRARAKELSISWTDYVRSIWVRPCSGGITTELM